MKYPQLVSTRAVNAISDWLVSRLEQLGVEAPQIYTRLLLSLLQSSVQIYDPIEFSNLETLSANRKGNNRRYLPCDTDTLKKLNAVQCLTGIVSSEQEIATIENLVDELCEKLKDIEKQTADIEDERKLLVATLSLATTSNTASGSSPSAVSNNYTLAENHSHHHNHHSHHHHHNRSRHHSNNKHHNNKEQHQQQDQEHNEAASAETADATAAAADIETDPRKRYFRAFPALSKEMEDSFRLWRKSLTWPVVRSNISSLKISSSSSPLSAASARGEAVTVGEEAKETYIEVKAINDEGKQGNKEESLGAVGVSSGHNIASASIAAGPGAAGVKRKSKRRRNQALSKGKTIQNIRKNSTGGGGIGGIGGAVGRHHHRHSSPSFWDTDFEGCWEMGRDLIKEFISRQNRNKTRNRSTSESAAYNHNNMRQRAEEEEEDYQNETDEEQQQHRVHHVLQLAEQQHLQNQQQHHEEETMNVHDVNESIAEKATKATESSSSPLMPIVDISFCFDDEYDDTLASISELANDASSLTIMTTATAAEAPPRRLYQRDVGGFGSNELLLPSEKVSAGAAYDDDEQLNFAQFKAKFNSSVEALWNDAVQPEQPMQAETAQGSSKNIYYLGSLDQAVSMPNTVAPFKENLKNFWSNYYSHHFDLANLPQQLSQRAGAAATADENNSVSLLCSAVGSAGADGVPTTSDYYSMPANLAEFDKSVGSVRRDRNATPTGLFLSNSIWSDSANINGGDTDESFYFKVWNSANKLNQLDVVSHGGVAKRHLPISESAAAAVAFTFPPYNHSKWSEGINAGPSAFTSTNATTKIPIQQQLRIQIDSGSSSLKSGSNSNANNNSGGNGNLLAIGGGVDCTDSSLSTASVSTTSCSSSYTHSSAAAAAAFNWQTPVIGHNLQADLQSWSTSNPMSLTEMYGGGGSANIIDTSSSHSNKRIGSGSNLAATTCETAGPNVTLPNHSNASSGFIEYARVKSVMKTLKPTADNVKQQQPQNYVAPARPKERYPEDENLLTSEYTHFHPIKTYVDGHTFDICSSLDSIEYERSQSGYLYLEADKYLEYTRNDSYMPEEDAASVGVFASATPLYASSNCDAAKARNGEGSQQSKKRNDFVIKFRMRNCDAACQTVDDEVARCTTTPQLDQRAFSLLLSGATASTATGFACNDAIIALNKAVAAAAKATAERSENHWVPTATLSANNAIGVGGGLCSESDAIGAIFRTYASWTAAQQTATLNITDDTCCDEVDCCTNTCAGNASVNDDADDDDVANELSCSTITLERQWSMHEIGKRCQLAGHGTTGTSTNNNIQNGQIAGTQGVAGIANTNTATTTHTLWSMCAACNSELKSIPANRLLRDELQLEADEIMSDLKYMQDLYIGRAADDDSDDAASGRSYSNWDSDDDANADENVMSDERKFMRRTAVAAVAKTINKMDDDDSSNCLQHLQQPQTHVVLQKVNRLIADLLRPENADRSSKTEDAAGSVTPQRQQFSGGGGGVSSLWYDHHNEGSIWQATTCDASAGGGCNNNNNNNFFSSGNAVALKPIELLRHFNVEPSAANALQAEGDTFLSQLSWEHDNLAEIWEKNTPPPPAPLHAQAVDGDANGNGVFETDDDRNKMTIANKNEKNLQATLAAAAAAKGTTPISDNNKTSGGDAIAPAATATTSTSTNISSAGFYPTHSTATAAAAATYKRVQQFLSSNASVTNANSSAAAKLKLANRKRRHSASQNYFHLPASTIDDTAAAINATTYSSNNNNVDLADLNRFSLTVITSNNQHTATATGTALVFDNIDGDDCNLQKYMHPSSWLQCHRRQDLAKKLQRKTNAAFDDIMCDNVICRLEGEAEGVVDEATDNIDDIELMQQPTIITCKYWTTIEQPPAAMMTTANDINIDGAKLACIIDKNASILKHVTMVTRPLTR